MRYTGPKKKLCRREGKNLFGSEKYSLDGSKRKLLGRNVGRMGLYGQQLRAKQSAKRMFGVSEKQFSNYFKKASRMKGNTLENMQRLLEMRLDMAVLKANFARTIMQARQFVSHAHFVINGQKVDIPSYQISVGDVIEVREKLKDTPIYKNLQVESEEFLKTNKSGKVSAVEWIDADPKTYKITIKRLPEPTDFDQSIDMKKIVEFYSK
ncbi:30S ribosomal protein S4 [Candidatus Gracilibacteria bacterium]|jgi:small subunit ribosomal protein S4|nr:30S ribosomal protein S4 [Candidatus Gracilibacteria bacterium]